MRLIQLMDAEFNINNKLIAKRMMKQAERTKTIPQDQYGSRKHHRSIIAALNKRLTMDLWRQKRQSGAIGMNDAEGCFDRIAHPVGAIVMRRFGVARSVVQCLYKTLQRARHCISTGFGVSEPKYGGPAHDPPVQGEGQGNGEAPATWVLISAILIQMMYTAGHGVNMVTAISSAAIAFVCFAFVDDTDVIHTGDQVDTPGEEIIAQFQEVLNCWEGGLRASGGAVVPEKSFWYLVDWKWTGTVWEYKSISQVPGDISIRSKDGTTRETLRRFEVNHAEMTLGIYLAMDGNERAQYQYLEGKVKEFTETLRVHPSTKNDVWYALERSFLKTIEYSLVVTTFTLQEWNRLLSPLLKVLLPRTGLSSKFPRDVLFGPTAFQGLNLQHPWYTQELEHFATLATELANSTQTGLLLGATMEQLYLELGLAGPLGTQASDVFSPLATPAWINSVWNLLGHFDIAFHHRTPTLPLLRHGDVYLMQAFADSGYRKADLQRLNTCRMFLQVTTLAEITTPLGCSFTSFALQGLRGEQLRPHINWPRQSRLLDASYWRLWARALQKTFQVPHSSLASRTLRQPLGPWITSAVHLPSTWKFRYSPTHNQLYQRAGLLWKVASPAGLRQGGRRPRFRFTDDAIRELPPHANHFASVYRLASGLIVEDLLDLQELPDPETTPTLTMADLPADSSYLVDELALPPDNCKAIAEGICQGTARSVSDGSFKDAYGTSAGTIAANAIDDQPLYFANSIPGLTEDQSAYRRELGGVLGTLHLIGHICKLFHIRSGSITMALDGQEALRQSSQTNSDHPLPSGQTAFDLLQAIRRTIELLPITIHWHWVEGHQREKGKTMDWWAKQNGVVDTLAKQYWNFCQEQQVPNTPRPLRHEDYYFTMFGCKLSQFNKKVIYEAIRGPPTATYWQTKSAFSFSSDMIDTIMWPAAGQAMARLPFGLRRFWAKFNTGFLGTSQRLMQRNFQTHSRCPRCGYEPEDSLHVLRCPVPEANLIWDRHVASLRLELTAAMLDNLAAWRQSCPPVLPPTNVWGERDAVNQQHTLGWNNFLFGRWHTQWGAAQDRYLASINAHSNPRRWASSIIYKLQMVAWDLWHHRNRTLYGPGGVAISAELSDLHDLIRNEFLLGSETLRERDRYLFAYDLSEILQWRRAAKRKWLRSVRSARHYSHDDDDDANSQFQQLQAQQGLMSRWLASASEED